MSVRRQLNTAYGFSSALLDVPLLPVTANRAPTANDKAAIGTLWVYKSQNLAYVITSIVDNEANWVQISQSSGDFVEYTVSTNDATPTALATFALPASYAITIAGNILGTLDDFSASLGGTFSGTFRRDGVGGGATVVGAPSIDIVEDSAGAPTVDLVVVGNSAVLTVTGVAAENWDWKAELTTATLT